MAKVYLETSFISYLVSRPSRDIIIAGNQQLTGIWWTEHRQKYECFVSELVIDESSFGDKDEVAKRMNVINSISSLNFTEDAKDLAARMLLSGVIPEKAATDAAHISIATVHKMDYILTWNVKHIANSHIFRQIERICEDSGFNIPILCTPVTLLEDKYV